MTNELDSSVRAALTQHLVMVGDDAKLRGMYPDGLPANPMLRRAYLFGQARSGTTEGWDEVKDAAGDSEPTTRAMAFDAAAALARSESPLAWQANGWLVGAQTDSHIVVQLTQAHAVGKLVPTIERRQWLSALASAATTPVDVAYAAAFHLMAECSPAVTSYAMTGSSSTPHAKVSQAIDTTLAAWTANGGPTCD